MTLVLVTGGSGFIGQHLVEALRARGQRVRIVDVRPPATANADVEYAHGSVLDRAAVDAALAGVDQVYHLAGLPGMWVANKQAFHDVNCRGTEIVLAAAMKRGVSRFLHCSTESILFPYSDLGGVAAEEALQPADAMPGAYTRSKSLAEHHAAKAAAAGFPLVIGTPTMPIGAADHNLTPPTAMLWYFLQKKVQPHLNFLVNLVDVRDVATGLVLTMERGRSGQRYILGGDCVPLGNILRMMSAMSGRRQFPVVVPSRIAELSAIMLEYISDHVTRRPPNGTAEGVRIALAASDLSIGKARTELGYSPRPIEPVLRETITHLLARGGKPATGAIEHHALSSRAS
ncbi:MULTISPECIES: NAD-dependent epimerase/dehydratase family protein [unclassified Bradyrhizobium]|uniref:NAD-dependent epimerase/dehydratase family protein n=1 Tax=unclassified Bradyrhizobium TaxID=2631580 RepID=UPI001FFBAD8E|nr:MULTISPECIES: NAD-dependent epimerase/dehydratase family protein [unclassified Bradyrhizobium]MCK1712556.1 NAD-dependent epimerase/dehydratase family protein [Bradyrhizobium sp. 143]MCK1727347.1 NAD-dependent epimerase/dehydratase family protein [Bradyrhizobium sp. 142]